ncbi:MAG: phosphoribosylformylglycinamidine synthase subunit PurQ [Alphaproteobacteria bacterium]|nr:phosphoribosylformylglycinamidine synthase subunit PurQ [Alphaproteobacteria bacterium]
MTPVVIVFPGSNCDRDVADGLAAALGRRPQMVWHADSEIPKCDLIVLPGGFSYGDYLRSGAIAAHSPVMEEVKRRAEAGVPVLGICNGFQILTEAGLLPGVLLRNAGLGFVCRWTHLRVERADTVFTAGYTAGQVVRFPVAHHDGNFFTDPATLKRIEGEGQVAFRYCTASGEVAREANPNGSLNNIAGVFNEQRSVLGLMPHPDRAFDRALGGEDGKVLFRTLVEKLAA